MKSYIFPIFLLAMTTHGQNATQTLLEANTPVCSEHESEMSTLQDVEDMPANAETDVWAKKRSWRFGVAFPFMTDFHHEIQDYCIWHLRPVGGVFVQHNRTGYLHRKPLNGRVRFGIDYGFCDVDYNCISYLACSDHKLYMNTLSYGVHVGPSANIHVSDKFNISIYAHVKPAFSALFIEDMYDYAISAHCAGGIQLAWRSMGVGAECQWYPTNSGSPRETHSMYTFRAVGPRMYIAYRF